MATTQTTSQPISRTASIAFTEEEPVVTTSSTTARRAPFGVALHELFGAVVSTLSRTQKPPSFAAAVVGDDGGRRQRHPPTSRPPIEAMSKAASLS